MAKATGAGIQNECAAPATVLDIYQLDVISQLKFHP